MILSLLLPGQIAVPTAILVENAFSYREISELKDKLVQEKLYLEEEIRSQNFEQIIGNSLALKHVLELVQTVAPTDSTVLLLGETGSGKELIARAIHDHSRRRQRTFVKLNLCGYSNGSAGEWIVWTREGGVPPPKVRSSVNSTA